MSMSRIAVLPIFLLAALLAGCALLSPQPSTTATPPRADPTPFRGLWVTRWDYRTPDDVRKCIDDAAALGATDVLWQVRGQADAFYKSDLEPWGRELFRDLKPGATSPGFDPLELAVRYAHDKGLKFHAWVNVMPVWKGKTPPADPRHMYNLHPSWRLMDSTGKFQPLTDHYVIVNPVLKDVQDHVVAVLKDIVTRYAVDGIHLDYIRFVSEKLDAKVLYPGDPLSLELFRKATGKTAVANPADRAAYQDWVRSRITELVRRIRADAVSARSGVVLTAAVWRRPEIGRDQFLQDGARWLIEGSIDRAIPMIYTDKDQQFADDLGAWLAAAPGRTVTPGLGAHMHAVDQSGRQIGLAKALPGNAAGYALFAYSALFESADPNQLKDEKSVFERSQRRKALAALAAPKSK